MNYLKTTSDFDFDARRGSNTATINVEMGQLEARLIFRKNYEGQIEITKPEKLQAVEEALKITGTEGGLQEDLDTLTDMYKAKLEDLAQIKYEKAIAQAREDYPKHWAVKVKPSDIPEGVTLEVTSLEEALEDITLENPRGLRLSAKLSYKGHSQSFDYEDVSSSYGGRNMKFVLYGRLTDYKRRNYASVKSLAKKFKKLVDEKIARDKRNAEYEAEKKARQQSELETLREAFGEVVVESRWVGSMHGKGFSVNDYFIVRGERKFKVSVKEDGFDFAGLGRLTKTQIQSILDIV